MDTLAKLCDEAWKIARNYNWYEIGNDTLERYLLDDNRVPEGFGKLVGQSIKIFKNPPQLRGLICSLEVYQRMREKDLQTAKELSRLRVLVAKINIKNRSAKV